MNIALAFGPSYVTPARVLLQSLREFCSPPIRLYLLHCLADPKPLDSLCLEFAIQAVHVPPTWFQGLPRLASHSLEAYLPLCLANSLPDLDRVLFLDADMLCLDDLRTVWNAELGGRVAGAVPDQAIPTFASARGVKVWKKLGLDPGQSYFNAGLMLLDLNRWRELDVTAAALDHLRSHPVDFLHQEALNVVLRNDWQPLELRWNVIASLYQRRYSPAALRGLARPGLVHYAGRFKPWRIQTHGRLGEIYRKRLDRPLEPSWRERALGFYDRFLRDRVYGLEHWFWSQR